MPREALAAVIVLSAANRFLSYHHTPSCYIVLLILVSAAQPCMLSFIALIFL